MISFERASHNLLHIVFIWYVHIYLFLQFKGMHLTCTLFGKHSKHLYMMADGIHTGLEQEDHILILLGFKHEYARACIHVHTRLHAFASILSWWVTCIHIRIHNESQQCLYFHPACLIPSSCLTCDFKQLMSSQKIKLLYVILIKISHNIYLNKIQKIEIRAL